MRTCSVDGCERKHKGLGYCQLHLVRFKQYGDPLGGPRFRIMNHGSACSIEGCDEPARFRGWCKVHYSRWSRHGDPTVMLDTQGLPALERFRRLQQEPDANGCRMWGGHIRADGYGAFEDHLAYKWIYEQTVGPVPVGLHLDHECHNADLSCEGGNACPHRACTETDHLVPKPPRDNVLAGRGPTAVNARKTHCKRGHELTPENTYVTPSTGHRSCRTCGREQYAERRRRRAA